MAHEVGEQLSPVGRVDDLRMEHQAVAPRILVGGNRVWRTFRSGHDLKPRRKRFHPVPMAHPHLVLLADVPEAIEKRGGRNDIDEGTAKLALIRSDDFAAKLLMQRLLTVANAEQREAAIEHGLRRARALVVKDR